MSAQIQSPKKLQAKLLLCQSCLWTATGTSGWKPEKCPACGAGEISRLTIRGIHAA